MTQPDIKWALFGATGVTGQLILARAIARGLRPTLAGRDAAALERLAAPHGLATAVASLDDAAALRGALRDHRLILNAAGPYSITSRPLIDAALAERVDYIDLDGEIAPFAALLARDAEAVARGTVLIAGAGFGVAAAETLAARLHASLGGVEAIRLAVAADSAFASAAVGASTLSVLEGGGRVIEDGVLVAHRLAAERWHERLPSGGRIAFASAPLVELLAMRRAFAAREVIAGVPMAAGQARMVSLIAPVLPALLRVRAIRRRMANTGGHGGSDEATGRSYCSRVWATARYNGRAASGLLEAGEGFATSSEIAVAAVERVINRRPAAGAHTPASAFGGQWADPILGDIRYG